MSSYKDLKKIIEGSIDFSEDKLAKIDFVFQEIVMIGDEDLKPSLDLIEGFLVEALESQQKNFKSVA